MQGEGIGDFFGQHIHAPIPGGLQPLDGGDDRAAIVQPSGEQSLAGVHVKALCQGACRFSHPQAVLKRARLFVMQYEQAQVIRLLP